MAVIISSATVGGRVIITIEAEAPTAKMAKVRDELVARTKDPSDTTDDTAYFLEWLRSNVVRNFLVSELDSANVRAAEADIPVDEDFD